MHEGPVLDVVQVEPHPFGPVEVRPAADLPQTGDARGHEEPAVGEVLVQRDLAGQGVAILVISSDLPEVLSLADRVLVMREGRLVGEFPGPDATEEAVMRLAVGAREAA